MDRVAVVGGGWAGLACAVELAGAGVPVTLYEAARHLGGRARRVDWHGTPVDNGPHILLGAYQETLRLLRRVGTSGLLVRRPLELLQPPHFHLRLPRLPAPLHLAIGLALARGLNWREKRAAARLIAALERTGYRLAEDSSVTALLSTHGQPRSLCERLWEPLCLAALNTPPAQASARIFSNVLRDSLGGARAASDLLLPQADLGRLFPEAAAEYLRARGGRIHLGTRIHRLQREAHGLRLDEGADVYESVVCAVHPARLGDLLSELPEAEPIRRCVGAFRYQPIRSIWLRFAAPLPFPAPMLGLADGPGQWAFDRADLGPGVAGVVISAEGSHLLLDKPALVEAVRVQLQRALGFLPDLVDSLVIQDKRATFAAVPGLKRPGNCTPVPGLYLAGDYTVGDYPATLEGAVRSGVQCARRILGH